jgi:hypothetical protein
MVVPNKAQPAGRQLIYQTSFFLVTPNASSTRLMHKLTATHVAINLTCDHRSATLSFVWLQFKTKITCTSQTLYEYILAIFLNITELFCGLSVWLAMCTVPWRSTFHPLNFVNTEMKENNKWELRFSRRRVWRWQLSAIWLRVVSQK